MNLPLATTKINVLWSKGRNLCISFAIYKVIPEILKYSIHFQANFHNIQDINVMNLIAWDILEKRGIIVPG